jgi:hypothetical protein
MTTVTASQGTSVQGTFTVNSPAAQDGSVAAGASAVQTVVSGRGIFNSTELRGQVSIGSTNTTNPGSAGGSAVDATNLRGTFSVMPNGIDVRMDEDNSGVVVHMAEEPQPPRKMVFYKEAGGLQCEIPLTDEQYAKLQASYDAIVRESGAAADEEVTVDVRTLTCYLKRGDQTREVYLNNDMAPVQNLRNDLAMTGRDITHYAVIYSDSIAPKALTSPRQYTHEVLQKLPSTFTEYAASKHIESGLAGCPDDAARLVFLNQLAVGEKLHKTLENALEKRIKAHKDALALSPNGPQRQHLTKLIARLERALNEVQQMDAFCLGWVLSHGGSQASMKELEKVLRGEIYSNSGNLAKLSLKFTKWKDGLPEYPIELDGEVREYLTGALRLSAVSSREDNLRFSEEFGGDLGSETIELRFKIMTQNIVAGRLDWLDHLKNNLGMGSLLEDLPEEDRNAIKADLRTFTGQAAGYIADMRGVLGANLTSDKARVEAYTAAKNRHALFSTP